MKVIFDGPSAVEHPATTLLLVPGVNEVSAEQGAALLACGVCKPAPPDVIQEPKAASPRLREQPAAAGKEE